MFLERLVVILTNFGEYKLINRNVQYIENERIKLKIESVKIKIKKANDKKIFGKQEIDFKAAKFVKIKYNVVLSDEFKEILDRSNVKIIVKNLEAVLKNEDALQFIKAII